MEKINLKISYFIIFHQLHYSYVVLKKLFVGVDDKKSSDTLEEVSHP